MLDDNIITDYKLHGTKLGVTEQLYTARGVQGIGAHKNVTKYGVDPSDWRQLMQLFINLPGVGFTEYE